MILLQEVLDTCFEMTGAAPLAEIGESPGRAGDHRPANGPVPRLLRYEPEEFAGRGIRPEPGAALLPLDPETRCFLADRFAKTGRGETAAKLYRELASDAGCSTALLPSVACGLGSLGHYEAALGVCREIIRRDSEHHQAHFGTAFYLRRLGQSAYTILPAVIRAHELAPEIPLYRISLAVLLEAIGWREDALDLLRDIDPLDVPCRCCLQKAMAIFREAGDLPRFESFRTQSDRLNEASLAVV